MKPIVLITGANSLISNELRFLLEEKFSLRFLSRNPKKANEFRWNVAQGFIDEKALFGVSHIIHLAGANIAQKRWSKKRKAEIISSRIDTATLLLNCLKINQLEVESFVSASAIGFYGSETSDKIYTENSPKGNDFLSDVVFKWEKIADKFKAEGVAKRVVKIRTGVVLTPKGGALSKITTPISFGIAPILGSGKQFINWISLTDVCRIYQFSVENNIDGVFNACANSLTFKELLFKICKKEKKKAFFIKIPEFFIKLIFGESAVILTQGSRVNSQLIENQGFTFKNKTIASL